ncbi:hypothetical protein [uncultured Paracoccus sp.]|uniref:hypothetical protein n=1 Tax=uncultured Paracoccus sp. TaxID=189685 RepID=UPI0025F01067|nr:hypothetical protein [uncultured Paracoccus sp.]
MKALKIATPLCAIAALAALAACETTPPATPEPTPGPSAASNALNGTYNLRASSCGTTGSDTGLVIDGSRFTFPETTCTVAGSEQQVSSTRVTLACQGSPAAGNRIVDLQIRDNLLRLTEDSMTLNYHLCDRAEASSDTRPAL